jgi:hypothetical protein
VSQVVLSNRSSPINPIFNIMRSKFYIFLTLLPCLAFTSLKDHEFLAVLQEAQTGIVLDSMDNQVMLVTEHGKPVYYTSHIFTPVCNTGECLPVNININWDLTGNFKSFDFDDGDILTKLDHVPFTESDYLLLDEILRGPDPRVEDLTKHSNPPSPRAGSEGDVSEGNPSPSVESFAFRTKYEMVDGITGVTAPVHREKFVPGALYTCYTLWGLANDHKAKMAKNTVDKLLQDNVHHLLERGDLKCQDFVLDELAKDKAGYNGKIEVMMEILDSTDGLINLAVLDRVYYYHFDLEIVTTTLKRKFDAPTSLLDPEKLVKKRILNLWAYNRVNETTITQLSKELHRSDDLFTPIYAVIYNHPVWPKGTAYEILHQLEIQQDPSFQEDLYDLLIMRKENLSEDEWERLKQVKKRYGF